MRAAPKRRKVVSIYVALNAAVSGNPLKHNEMVVFLADCYSLKNLVRKSSVGTPLINRFQRWKRCFSTGSTLKALRG